MNNFKIALNDTLESRLLVNSQLVTVDALKYPSIAKPCKSDFDDIFYKTIYHGLVAKGENLPDILSHHFIKDVDVENTQYFLKHSNSSYISIHIGDNLKDLTDDECILHAKTNINFVKKYIMNMDRQGYIALENMESGSNENTLKPEFISRLVNVTGTKFLLDTAHATIAASILGMNVYEYISKLPLDKVCEIHFSGTQVDGKNIFSHIRATEKDYKLLEHVLSLTNPEIVTIEYGLFDTQYANGFLNTLPKVSYSQINFEALNEILYMYYRVNKMRKHSRF